MNGHFQSKKIVTVTSCTEAWGGSEELWANCIPLFRNKGYETYVLKNKIDYNHKRFKELRDGGTHLIELLPEESRVKRILKRNWQKVRAEIKPGRRKKELFEVYLESIQPSIVLIAQGINFDGLGYGCICAQLKIPYVIICQKAVDFYWPNYYERQFMTESLLGAAVCFFVSRHNKRLTEEQFGVALPNSSIIFNPVKLSRKPLPYPSTKNGFRLACIGRLFLLDKGQDMLIRILSKPKWQNRPVHISFYGSGVDETGLKAMAAYLQVKQVTFEGYAEEISNLWHTHHGLILPSRSEGSPLALMEAMAVGRIGIVSNAGGNAELIADGRSGFVGSVCEEGIEEAMERAWTQRDDWEQMGITASAFIVKNIPESPENEFFTKVLQVLNGQ